MALFFCFDKITNLLEGSSSFLSKNRKTRATGLSPLSDIGGTRIVFIP